MKPQRDVLVELAERCEKATGPDRELDQDIMDALVRAGVLGFKIGPAHFRVTASLDAAMAMVPDGNQFGAGRDNIIPGPEGWAWVSDDDDTNVVKAATPALALCAASLRALAGGRNG